MLRSVGREPDRALVAKRHIDRAFGNERIVVAVAYRAVARQLADLRLDGDDVDRAASGVAAIERALRSLQHLNTLEIEEHPRRARRPSDVDAIIVERDRRIAVRRDGEVADAADEDQVASAGRLDRQRRYLLVQSSGLGHAGGRDVRSRDDVDRHRRALQVLRSALGGDDDIYEALAGQRCLSVGYLRGTAGGRLWRACGRHRLSPTLGGSLRMRKGGHAANYRGGRQKQVTHHIPSKIARGMSTFASEIPLQRRFVKQNRRCSLVLSTLVAIYRRI